MIRIEMPPKVTMKNVTKAALAALLALSVVGTLSHTIAKAQNRALAGQDSAQNASDDLSPPLVFWADMLFDST